jgi:N-acetyl-gamma-glutamyl-phosphate reductase
MRGAPRPERRIFLGSSADFLYNPAPPSHAVHAAATALARVFIDGQAGTTGLEISERLRGRRDLELLEIDPAERKNPDARRCLMAGADVSVLCLPDAAAREAAALAPPEARIIDASTAHRTDPAWVYGCPELGDGQREAIAAASRVSNPGCYPQGFLLLIKPLVAAGILSRAAAVTVLGLSGYSGGGRSLIEQHQNFSAAERERWNTRPYALSLEHKHVPEMQHYAGLEQPPLFVPTVGHFYRGMLIQIPLFATALAAGSTLTRVHDCLAERYAQEPFVEVLPANGADALDGTFLDATTLNGSNRVQLLVYGHDQQMLLLARYDNLVKGAAGAAVQNLNLMLGVRETEGLTE